jgi:hypothetical protein
MLFLTVPPWRDYQNLEIMAKTAFGDSPKYKKESFSGAILFLFLLFASPSASDGKREAAIDLFFDFFD